MKNIKRGFSIFLLSVFVSQNSFTAKVVKNVYITGYELVRGQTDSTPHYGAWQDNLYGTVNAVAVPVGSVFDKRGLCIKVPGFDYSMIVLDHKDKRFNGKAQLDIVVESKKQARKYTGYKDVKILPVGSCDLIRKVDGGLLFQKFSKKERFEHPKNWNK